MPDAPKPVFDPAPLIEAAKKATKGRWRIDHTGVRVKAMGKGAQVICHVIEVYMNRGEREANARLIATSHPVAILAWAERDAEQQAEIKALREGLVDARQALKAAEHFIVNGVELGFISMPDTSTPDPAHETLPMLRSALSRARALLEPGR